MIAVIGSVAGLVGLGLLVAFCDALRRVDQPKPARSARRAANVDPERLVGGV